MEFNKKMWGGCFTKQPANTLSKLNSSIHVDKRMYKEDIIASQAYAKSLFKAEVLNKKDFEDITDGLEKIMLEWEKNLITIDEHDEDIHTLNERRLRELIGEAADRLHTGRSRNDQVATDVRLWLFNNGVYILQLLYDIVETITELATREIDIIMPGYTHLKRAQPVRFSHFILSHAWNFQSDSNFLKSILQRTAILPLGSGALAGNPFPIDRNEIARDLNFNGVTMNSMNAVGNRDFIAEFLFWCSLCGTHFSRLAEDLIIFNTDEFKFINISEEFSTGSSLLPHKRNPDGLELARAAAGRLIGNSTGFLVTLKSLPSTYNKDLQCDKQILFESFDLTVQVLQVLDGTIKTLKVNSEFCINALKPDQLTATLAHYLVKKGLPFRQAHHIVGRLVAESEEKNIPLNNLPEEDRIKICELLSGDWSEMWNYENAVEEHQAVGGTSRQSVEQQIIFLKKWIQQSKNDF